MGLSKLKYLHQPNSIIIHSLVQNRNNCVYNFLIIHLFQYLSFIEICAVIIELQNLKTFSGTFKGIAMIRVCLKCASHQMGHSRIFLESPEENPFMGRLYKTADFLSKLVDFKYLVYFFANVLIVERYYSYYYLNIVSSIYNSQNLPICYFLFSSKLNSVLKMPPFALQKWFIHACLIIHRNFSFFPGNDTY